MARRWWEGSSDPLDSAVHLSDLAGPPDPRKLDVPIAQQQVVSVTAEAPVECRDPLEILADCEDLDEQEGCERGAHLEEYIAAHSQP